MFGTYEGFQQRLARSSASIVPGTFARQGLLPNGSPVPDLKPQMLKYANAFWPAPSTPDRPDGTAVAYANPGETIGENFGLARFDHILSSTDSFAANLTVDSGLRQNPWGGGGGGDPNFKTLTDNLSKTFSLKETHVFSSTLVNVATLGYSATLATLVNVPAVPMPADIVFLEGGNPGTIVIGGGIGAAAQSAVAGVPGNNPSRGTRRFFTYSDDVRFIKGKHSWSMGGWFHKVQQNMSGVALGSAGNVAYRTVLDFLQDRPTQAIVTRNPSALGFRTEGAWYVQDDMKLRSNFTLRLGLRHEMTNGWNEVVGRCSDYRFDSNFLIQTNPGIGPSCLDENHAKLLLQPRVGLAWDPTGKGTWSVRAAFGIHNDLLDSLGNRIQPNAPFAAREQLTVTNGFLPLLPLQKNIPLPPTCGPGIPSPCGNYQPNGVDPNMFTPTIQIWDLTVDRQLGKDLMLQVGYVGSQSYHTSLTMYANTVQPQVCQNPQGCRSGGFVPASRAATVPQGTTYLPSTPGQRPNPYVSYTVTWFNQGTTSYHGLNVSLLKRAARGLTFKANYSWGKVLDLNSALLAPSGENEPPALFSPYNRQLNKGAASYSLEHQFNTNFSYQLPFGSGQRFGSGASGWLNHLIGAGSGMGSPTFRPGFPSRL